MQYLVAGVGVATAYSIGASPRVIFTSNTLQEESLSLSVTAEDIRGGMSNPLLGRYFHDSLLESTLTDALFDMEYIALNCGGDVKVGNDALTTESVVVAQDGSVTVTGTPTTFGDAGTVGWIQEEGKSGWTLITFDGQKAQKTGITGGSNACVRYNEVDAGMEYFTVPSSVIPSIVHMVMEYPLFTAGTNTENVSEKTQVGKLIVDIPRFQFSGTFDFSLTSSGAATSNLSGQALAYYHTVNCEDMGQYATVKKKIFDNIWYQNLTGILVDGAAELSLNQGDTKTLTVLGIYDDAKVGVIPNSKLSFSSDTIAIAEVSAAGVITAKEQAGTAHIEIKPTKEGQAEVPAGVAGYVEVTVA